MLLRFEDDRSFTQGNCTYQYRPAAEQAITPRIIVPIKIEGVETQAILDTGGVYLICDPQIAELLDLDPAGGLETDRLNFRGTRIGGALFRLSLTLLAQEGQSLELEVTAFVPRLEPYQLWDLPSFMGLMGCLERLRFAVDPATDTFHFGSIQAVH